MKLILLFAILVCIFITVLVVFLFFNREKSSHQIVLQNIENNIELEKQILKKQRSQLEIVQDSTEFTRVAMEKVIQSFEKTSSTNDVFVDQHLENLAVFSENSLELIKIYNRFVKVVS